MARIDYQARQIRAKILYWGPSLGGKWTNLDYVYRVTGPADRPGASKETSIGLPLKLGDIRGFATTFDIFRCPSNGALTKFVLDDVDRKPVDGIMFIADSAPSSLEANRASLVALDAELRARGFDRAKMPCVLQYNKRDVPGALPLADLEAALNQVGHPTVEAIANRGTGVFDTIKACAKLVLSDLRKV